MELRTISEVTRAYQVSTRTLRYYEKIGLLQSVKIEGYAYRTYDQAAVQRLEGILFLRKLRIPLKEIPKVLGDGETEAAVAVFQEKIRELAEEIEALSAIRAVVERFAVRLAETAGIAAPPLVLEDKDLRGLIEALPVTKPKFKEELTMQELNQADRQLSKLKDVRIVYLPPSTVASVHQIGGNPEQETGEKLQQFMEQTRLAERKPDLRHYGFNHPNGEQPDGSDHGYERWVTIPDDLELPEPFVKKSFPGGLYAAHMIPLGNFEEWGWLSDWVQENGEYEENYGDPACMHGLMEEHLNYINLYPLTPEELGRTLQLDLLFPVKHRMKAE
ncbi:MerR family transcriptional regulator [Gorillibacterium sp. sgz500922]|uniref:MerR family transcriptional regulator n=1 Tax=Gorillibacterium sp. sgz500922 TaxID=3446694 RepID=UPI003F669B09